MSGTVELVWCGDDSLPYDFGPQHPLRPERVWLGRRLIHDYGMGRPLVTEVLAEDAEDDQVLLVHTASYLKAVKAAGEGKDGDWSRFSSSPRWGLGLREQVVSASAARFQGFRADTPAGRQ